MTPICDKYVLTTGSEESISLVMKTPPLVTKTPPSVAQDPDLAPPPPDCTSTDEDNVITTPIDIDDEPRNSDDDDLTAKHQWITDPTYKTCGNSLVKRKDKSYLWKQMKRLQKDQEKVCLYTHI